LNTPNAPEYHLNASISGGASNAQYYLSVGHVHQTYNYNPDDNKFKRTNLTANLQTSLSNAFTIGTELKANYELRDEVAVLGATDPIRTFILTAHSSWPTQDPYTGPDHDLVNNQVRSPTRSVAILNQDISGLQQDDRRQASANFWAVRTPFGMTAKATVSIGGVLRQFDLARKFYCLQLSGTHRLQRGGRLTNGRGTAQERYGPGIRSAHPELRPGARQALSFG
jgi:hypothetical protein